MLCLQAAHSRPGQPYAPRGLSCWIRKGTQGDDCPDGDVVAALLERAFRARVLFTVKSDLISWHGAVVDKGILKE